MSFSRKISMRMSSHASSLSWAAEIAIIFKQLKPEHAEISGLTNYWISFQAGQNNVVFSWCDTHIIVATGIIIPTLFSKMHFTSSYTIPYSYNIELKSVDWVWGLTNISRLASDTHKSRWYRAAHILCLMVNWKCHKFKWITCIATTSGYPAVHSSVRRSIDMKKMLVTIWYNHMISVTIMALCFVCKHEILTKYVNKKHNQNVWYRHDKKLILPWISNHHVYYTWPNWYIDIKIYHHISHNQFGTTRVKIYRLFYLPIVRAYQVWISICTFIYIERVICAYLRMHNSVIFEILISIYDVMYKCVRFCYAYI